MRYIKVNYINTRQIDENRIREDEKWDGYYAIETNMKLIQPMDIFRVCQDLWKIEEPFRILKSHMQARGIFHRTEKGIKGHFVLCFIAFLIERILEDELSKNNIDYSPYKIRRALNELQYSEMEIEGERLYLRIKVEGVAYEILRGLKKLPSTNCSPDFFSIYCKQ